MSGPLTLRHALRVSVEFHPIISAKKREYQAALGELSAARWAAFPNASFSFRGFEKNDEEASLDQKFSAFLSHYGPG